MSALRRWVDIGRVFILCDSDFHSQNQLFSLQSKVALNRRCCPMFASVSHFTSKILPSTIISTTSSLYIVYSRLRYTQPELVRPIKVNLFWPILYLICTVFVVVVPMYAEPVQTGIGCLMIASSIPVYFVLIAWRNKPKTFQRGMGEYWIADTMSFISSIVANCLSQISFEILFPKKNIIQLSYNRYAGALNQKLQKLLMVVRPKTSQVQFWFFIS